MLRSKKIILAFSNKSLNTTLPASFVAMDYEGYDGPIYTDDDYIQLCYEYTEKINDPYFSTESCIEQSCLQIYSDYNYCSR